MAVNVLMPALSPTMEAGTLAKWLVNEGDSVSSGDLLAEIETDKAVMEFEAVDEGVVARILVAEGTENVPVNSLIAVLAEEGEDPETAHAAPADAAPVGRTGDAPPDSGGAAIPAVQEEPPAGDEATVARNSTPRIFASPLARRLAAERGIDLAAVTGSGPHGRIIKVDIESWSEPVATRAPAPASAVDVEATYADRPYRAVELGNMRRIIAARLSEAKQTIPHFYLRRGVEIDRLLELRRDVNAGLERRQIKVSVNDFVIKACALALQDVPGCNAVWAGDRILEFEHSDIAVAVAIDGGLMTPVLHACESRSISDISVEMKALAARAREKKLAPEEYKGGSFSISNLGMLGVESFDAVINPPHASILAVGAGRRRPVASEDGEITVATIMEVTLSVDHRVIDGALGAAFLDAVANYLENPAAALA